MRKKKNIQHNEGNMAGVDGDEDGGAL